MSSSVGPRYPFPLVEEFRKFKEEDWTKCQPFLKVLQATYNDLYERMHQRNNETISLYNETQKQATEEEWSAEDLTRDVEEIRSKLAKDKDGFSKEVSAFETNLNQCVYVREKIKNFIAARELLSDENPTIVLLKKNILIGYSEDQVINEIISIAKKQILNLVRLQNYFVTQKFDEVSNHFYHIIKDGTFKKMIHLSTGGLSFNRRLLDQAKRHIQSPSHFLTSLSSGVSHIIPSWLSFSSATATPSMDDSLFQLTEGKSNLHLSSSPQRSNSLSSPSSSSSSQPKLMSRSDPASPPRSKQSVALSPSLHSSFEDRQSKPFPIHSSSSAVSSAVSSNHSSSRSSSLSSTPDSSSGSVSKPLSSASSSSSSSSSASSALAKTKHQNYFIVQQG